ncbi:polyhydroxyalkanoic acid synthase [Halioglobus sp. HI00S01]|nr:polyhydroxyalkanoic acid synthase [Halioglobus sp. HI00S01]
MPKEDVRAAAEGLVESLAREHGVRSRWDGDQVRIKGAGVDGQLSFHDDLIDVSVKLGLLTSMFESTLRKEVQRYLDEHVS